MIFFTKQLSLETSVLTELVHWLLMLRKRFYFTDFIGTKKLLCTSNVLWLSWLGVLIILELHIILPFPIFLNCICLLRCSQIIMIKSQIIPAKWSLVLRNWRFQSIKNVIWCSCLLFSIASLIILYFSKWTSSIAIRSTLFKNSIPTQQSFASETQTLTY